MDTNITNSENQSNEISETTITSHINVPEAKNNNPVEVISSNTSPKLLKTKETSISKRKRSTTISEKTNKKRRRTCSENESPTRVLRNRTVTINSLFGCESDEEEEDFHGFDLELEEEEIDMDLLEISNFYKFPDLLEPLNDLIEVVDPNEIQEFVELSFDATEPKVIPLERICNQNLIKKNDMKLDSILGRILKKMDFNKNRKFNEKPINVNISNQIRNFIKNYLNTDWNSENLFLCFSNIMKFSNYSNEIIFNILNLIETSTDTNLEKTATPPAPPLPVIHQRIILLVKRVSEGINGFLTNLITELDVRLFSLRTKKNTIFTLMNFTYLYIGLIELMPEGSSKARYFIYKSLYFYSNTSTPMVYAILRTFKNVLPKKSFYDKSDKIVNTIVTILMNKNYNRSEFACTGESLFMKSEMLYTLTRHYEYNFNELRIEDQLNDLINEIKTNNVQDVADSLMLLGKHQGYIWASKNIVQSNLSPMLNEYIEIMSTTDENDDKIITCLQVISSIQKTAPIDEDVTQILQIFFVVLQSAKRQRIQEAAVEALLKMSRFGMVDIFHRISKWNPSCKINQRLYLMLKTFVYRKSCGFWKNLINRN